MSPTELAGVLEADACLCEVGLSVDFGLAVTPVDVPQAWKRFHASGYRALPEFSYRATSPEIAELRRRLSEVRLDNIDDPQLATLLKLKQREIRTQLDCLEFRNTPKFLEASRKLYGGVDRPLVKLAELILLGRESRSPTPGATAEPKMGSAAFARRAEIELAYYRGIYPGLTSKVRILNEIPGIMAFEGDLLIGTDFSLPASRVQALIQHEIGTHVVTFANGGVQRLQMLRIGLPGYEETQEALAVFSEYVVGGLSGARLAQLAARVMAVDGLLEGHDFVEVFASLRRRFGLPPRAAFFLVARVFRSGGLTKDAIYLRGIVALLAYLAGGGALEPLFVGKLPLTSVPVVEHLQQLGLVAHPPLRPRWADVPEAEIRIDAARKGISVVELIKEEAA